MERRSQRGGFARVAVAATMLLPAVLVWRGARDAFRLPKLLASEWLGLFSVLMLCRRLLSVESLSWRGLIALDPLRAVAPLWAVASLGWMTASHREHFASAWWSFSVGALCLVAWSLGAPGLRRLLDLLVIPGAVLAGFSVLHFHDLFRLPVEAQGRMLITSLAGNVGELGAYLVLPAVVCLANLVLELGRRRRRPLYLAIWLIAGGVIVYGLAVTQSLAAFLALGAAGLVLLWHSGPSRLKLVGWLGAGALTAALIVVVTPLEKRVTGKMRELARGEINDLLTGRLDGWRAAAEMGLRHPVAGVGLGGYAAEYTGVKLQLMERGVPFWEGHAGRPTFANAHNEFLEVAAETGLLGVLALLIGVWVLGRRLWRAQRSDGLSRRGRVDLGLGWAIVAVAGVLSLAHFPFRTALVAYPLLLGLSWVLSEDWPGGAER